MDIAEDRGRFSDMLKELGIPYPRYGTAYNTPMKPLLKLARPVGYPVLVVLPTCWVVSVAAHCDQRRRTGKRCVGLLKHLPGNKILIDHFLDRCREAEIDAIFDGEQFHVMG